MPRYILVPDDLEARIRETAGWSDGVWPGDVLAQVLALIDASHASQRARADQHHADNYAPTDDHDTRPSGGSGHQFTDSPGFGNFR